MMWDVDFKQRLKIVMLVCVNDGEGAGGVSMVLV